MREVELSWNFWLLLIFNENCSIMFMGRVYISLYYIVVEQQNKFFYNNKEKNLMEY